MITPHSQKTYSQPPAYFARLYKDNGLVGGHVIKLGPGNDGAAKEALQTWPGLFQRLDRVLLP
jgi:phosphoribosylformimino-5-aminoimidazole carboxamide ribotide isomerase